MSLSQLKSKIQNENIKVLFTDFYDTLVHRKVHPNYTLRLWAKFIIRELGLSISIDELYFIRQESLIYLTKKNNTNSLEIPYKAIKNEVCKRLINNDILSIDKKESFINLFEEADFRSESNVQYLNQDVLNILLDFKKNGGIVYLVSDFYGSKSLFIKMLKHHGVLSLFEDIFSSASLEKSKHSGTIYKDILNKLSLNGNDVIMIGDNKISDFDNAKKNKLHSFLLPHNKYLIKNKIRGFGNDKKRLKKVFNNLYKDCNKHKTLPYTEYIAFYHVFVEELYKKCKRENIKTLFFLAREGLFLKKLFDAYQEYVSIDSKSKINSCYLKISRQASLQISLKPIDEEEFDYFKKKYPTLSIEDFLATLNCPKEIINRIKLELKITENEYIIDFFDSDKIKKIKSNTTFREFYEIHRKENCVAFKNYINSLNTEIDNDDNDDMTLVDIGWGGTMQESIYNFFDKKTKITGCYLGLKEIYDIQEKTKRSGLLFSILPYASYNDHILMANTQLYEQFAAANHGSSIGYTNKNNSEYSIEYYQPKEKFLFDNYIKNHQVEMYNYHKILLKKLDNICYDGGILKCIISNLSLKIGLYQNSRKLKFIKNLNTGFYQNIGTNQVGINYKIPKKINLFKDTLRFLIVPEKYFSYLVKLKPVIYEKNKLVSYFFPSTFLYLYFRFNKFLRFKLMKKILLLKYNALK